MLGPNESKKNWFAPHHPPPFQLNASAVSHDSKAHGEADLSLIETDRLRIHFCVHKPSRLLVAVLTGSEIRASTGSALALEVRDRFVAKYEGLLAQATLQRAHSLHSYPAP